MKIYTNLTKLKYKILLVLTLFIFLAVTIGISGIIFNNYVNEYNRLLVQAERISYLGKAAENASLAFLLEEVSSEEFMESGKSYQLDNFNASIEEIEQILADPAMQNMLLVNGSRFSKEQLQTIENYKTSFGKLSEKVRERGYRNLGLEGRMRRSVHGLEEKVKAIDLAAVLMMRRHEKDFIIRKDLSYVDKLQQVAQRLMAGVAANEKLPATEKEEINRVIQAYLNDFNKVVALEKEIGLEALSGLRGTLKQDILAFGKGVEQVKATIEKQCETVVLKGFILMGSFIVVLIVGGIALSFFLADIISKPIVWVSQAAQAVTAGSDDVEQYLGKITNKDEVGELADNFRIMYAKLNQTIREVNSKSEVLEKMIEENKHRVWHSEGIGQLNELLRSHTGDSQQMAEKGLAYIVKYLNANQGCLFLHRTNDDMLHLAACYAYGKKKWQEKTVLPGQGLVGQCYLEQSSIHLTDIPKGYINITSGLGEATPGFILLTPLKTHTRITGVLELASFSRLTPHQVAFAEHAAESIAAVIDVSDVSSKFHEFNNTFSY